jgi:hypothetical protein
MRKKSNKEIERLTKEVMELIDGMKPNTVTWLKAYNKLRRIRLATMNVYLPDDPTPESLPYFEQDIHPDGKTSQKDMILEYLQLGNPITPLEALRHFGCFRLGARIADIKKDGHTIRTEMVTDKRTGKRYASYSLIEK